MGFAKLFFGIIAALLAIIVYFILRQPTLEPFKPLEEKWWGEGERKAESQDVVPFQITFHQKEYTQLLQQLQNTRYFESLENVNWTYGTRPDFMKNVVDHWIKKFSWKNQVDYINSFKQFKTNIDGISMHFLHIKPSNVQPDTKIVPLLLVHGWPGSFFEFHKTIPELSAEKDGFAFELVIPSLPGYGYSSAPRKSGLDPAYIALIMKKLMLRLGHQKFYVQGGDWGSEVSRMTARLFPEHVKGMHLNMWSLMTNPKYPILTHVVGAIAPSWVVPDKRERDRVFPLKNVIKFMLEVTGYYHIQATKPDTVGLALNDSPAGLASYILEKFVFFFDLSDCQSENTLKCVEDRASLDEMLTNVMIYWTSNSMPTAIRLYKEAVNSENWDLQDYPIYVPAGLASFPREDAQAPRSWVEALCPNLIHFSVMKRGGHFPAFEEPVAFSDDVRKFIYKVEQLNQH